MEKRIGKSTPWGQSQGSVELAEGIIAYHTSSHGGIWLSKDRQAKLGYANNWLKDPAWWEEDCDWAVPYAYFANDIQAHGNAFEFTANLEAAKRTVKTCHPEFYPRLEGI